MQTFPSFKAAKKVFPLLTEKAWKDFKDVFPQGWAYGGKEKALEELSLAVGGYGVEGWVFPDSFKDGFSYINMGDTYTQTLCYRSDTGQVWLGGWGQFVENNPELAE